MFVNVLLLTPSEIIFEGKAKSVIVPGESGVFEILPYHHRVLSRLISGVLFIDDQPFSIKRGMVKVNQNKATIIVEKDYGA